MHAELTEVEKVHFAELTDLLAGQYSNAEPALIRASLHGRDVSVVASVQFEGDQVHVAPVAVLVDPEMFEQLLPPGEPEIVHAAD